MGIRRTQPSNNRDSSKKHTGTKWEFYDKNKWLILGIVAVSVLFLYKLVSSGLLRIQDNKVSTRSINSIDTSENTAIIIPDSSMHNVLFAEQLRQRISSAVKGETIAPLDKKEVYWIYSLIKTDFSIYMLVIHSTLQIAEMHDDGPYKSKTVYIYTIHKDGEVNYAVLASQLFIKHGCITLNKNNLLAFFNYKPVNETKDYAWYGKLCRINVNTNEIKSKVVFFEKENRGFFPYFENDSLMNFSYDNMVRYRNNTLIDDTLNQPDNGNLTAAKHIAAYKEANYKQSGGWLNGMQVEQSDTMTTIKAYNKIRIDNEKLYNNFRTWALM